MQVACSKAAQNIAEVFGSVYATNAIGKALLTR